MTTSTPIDLRSYAIVTMAYWAFTLTDGALRMLVLLHFHKLGFSPLELAYLFLLYEFCGVVTNLVGGWFGAKYGLRSTLFIGLFVQFIALLLLSFVQVEWALWLSVSYVMISQALSGVAKDLTKMSSKSTVKLIVGIDTESTLLKYVAILTGSKNALKGVGFFIGGILLEYVGFRMSLWLMATFILTALLLSVLTLKSTLGEFKDGVKFRAVFSNSREINLLSLARFFLFGSRDVWFVVALPVFLYDTLQWSFSGVGSFLAAWVIGYGFVQASVPRLIRKNLDTNAHAKLTQFWGFVLALVPLCIAVATVVDFYKTLFVLVGLMLFGVVFAINSALHSYLVLAYSEHDKVALSVGFYYMSNALGRLVGTLLSGLVFLNFGISGCLFVSGGMILLAALLVIPLGRVQESQSRLLNEI